MRRTFVRGCWIINAQLSSCQKKSRRNTLRFFWCAFNCLILPTNGNHPLYTNTNPITRYSKAEMTATVSEYGSCVLTWSMWSEAAPVEARTDVSDSGEQWSPKTPPPATAAIVATTRMETSPPEKVKASGAASGMTMAKVPHEVPVAKEMTAQVIKIRNGSK